MRSKRSLFGPVSLTLASMLAISSSSGCSKLEELTGDKKEETKTEEPTPEPEAEPEAKDDGGDEEQPKVGEKVAVVGGGEVEVAVVEPIPVEELHTGLDLMLKLIPEGSEFMIARDATVVADYVEEATRFLDGPMATLKTGPFAGERDLQEAEENFDEVKVKIAAVKTALEGSGIQLSEGAAFFETKSGDEFVVFNAPDPGALAALGKALGEKDFEEPKCKAIESAPGFNICSDSQAAIDAYQPSTDPAPLRKELTDAIPGIDLDEANLLAHASKGERDEIIFVVTTIPGQFHMAANMPANEDLVKLEEGMEAGPATTLAQVQPGSGFIWGRMSKKLLEEPLEGLKGTPGEPVGKSMTGEFVLAGSVDPGGLIFQAGTSDVAGVEGLLGMGYEMGKDEVPKEIPDVKGAKVVFEKVPLEGGSTKAEALHVGVTGVPEADVLKSFTGLHLDAWAFAANDVFTLAVGPDKEHVGKLLDVEAGGPSADTLAGLPPQLADGLGKNEVGFIAHMPMDFLHGHQMHRLIRASLKEVPEAEPEQVIAGLGLLAPFSTSTMWIAQPSGGKPVVHISVQSIGNRATDEGRAALDAAHTVADGGDPVAAFASLSAAYGASPMAWAYKTRAGIEGPGYMVGSGLGAVLATAAVAVPVFLDKSNEALADDLGVKPETPEPELKPKTKPKQPKTTKKPKADPKKDEPKKDPKKDEPKKDPKKDEPKEDPKKDDPIVEPDRPLPPKPTLDPSKKKKGKKFGKSGK